MPMQKIKIKKGLLKKLYIKHKLSPLKIGTLLGCSFSTVTNRLKEHGIPRRTLAESHIRYPKKPFTGSLTDKAYILGFAIGDLNTFKPSPNSVTLVTRCHTTQFVQVDVLQKCFRKYGQVTISHSNNGFTVNVFLDAKTFNFLLEDTTIPAWIKGKTRWAFIAGYNDAEGNLILNQKRARLKIDTYDYFMLSWIQRELLKEQINAKLRKIGTRGDLRSDGTHLNSDLWRLNVNAAESLHRLLTLLLPYTKHQKRRADARRCLKNIHSRVLKKAGRTRTK